MNHESPDDGYAIVRLMLPLRERLRGDPLTIWSCFIAQRTREPFAYIAGRIRDEGIILQPTRLDWRNGEFFVRLHSMPAEEGFTETLATQAVIAEQLWSQTLSEPFSRKLSEGFEFPARTAIEVVCIRSVMLDCPDCLNAAINHATRAGLAVAASFQISDSFARNSASELVTAETIQRFVLMGVETFTLDGVSHRANPINPVMPYMMIQVNLAEPDAERPGLDEGVATALCAISRDFIFARHIELVAEATNAVFLRGQYSQGLMVAAQACEYLLDMYLLFMMWWDGVTPKAAASEFRETNNLIATRVKTCYSRRLGDLWDESSTILTSWRDAVARVRNRVIHGGARAILPEADVAIDVARQLRQYMAEIASASEVLDKYPPLHALLVGDSLLPSGFPGMRAEEFYGDSHGAKQRFQAWVALFHGELGLAPKPSQEYAEVLLSPLKRSGIEWWLYDVDSHKVALANKRSVDPWMRREMEERAGHSTEEGIFRPYARFGIQPAPDIAKGSQWKNAASAGPGVPYFCPWA